MVAGWAALPEGLLALVFEALLQAAGLDDQEAWEAMQAR